MTNSLNSLHRLFTIGIMFFVWCGFGVLVHADTSPADTPSISSFSFSPSSAPSGYIVSATWQGSYATGYDVYFSCPPDVTLSYLDGSTLPCNSTVSVGDASVTSLGFKVNNNGGTSKTVTANLYPRDLSGTDYTLGAATASFTTTSISNPILSFSASPSVASSTVPITFTWTGNPSISGTNISFDCAPNLSVAVLSPTVSNPVCGSTLFSSALGSSGSIMLFATNTSSVDMPLTVRVWPGTSSGSYDGTHSMAATASIHPYAAPVSVHPSVTQFISSVATSTPNQVPFTLSWNVQNTTGVNVQFQCATGLSISSVTTNNGTISTSTVPCGVVAMSAPLPASGSATFSAADALPTAVSLGISLWPQDTSGAYNVVYGSSSSLIVLPPASTIPTQATIATSSTTTAASTPTASIVTAVEVPTSKSSEYAPHAPFTQTLYKGSRGVQVRLLQQFLAQDADIYPEGTISGYFGSATQAAVERFQDKYGIAHFGNAGYGIVGPKTRTVLNMAQTP